MSQNLLNCPASIARLTSAGRADPVWQSTIAGSGLDTPGDEEEEMIEHDYDLDPNLAFPRVNWGRLGSTFGELLQSCGYSQEVLEEYKHVRDVKVRSVASDCVCVCLRWPPDLDGQSVRRRGERRTRRLLKLRDNRRARCCSLLWPVAVRALACVGGHRASEPVTACACSSRTLRGPVQGVMCP